MSLLKGQLISSDQVLLPSGQKLTVEVPSSSFQVGDRVLLTLVGDSQYVVSDHLRTQPLLVLFLIFAAISILIGRIRGITSLIGLVYSFLIIFYFILPQIISSQNPLFIAIIGAILISPITFYLSHGFNRQTTIALFSTFLSLVFTGILAAVFVEFGHLTGLASEEAGFVLAQLGENISIKGLLLAGIIIGSLGILDDVTVSQSAVVTQLHRANPKFSVSELFRRAMEVGRDHVSSMVNTLVLVYAGASLPLLLLFVISSQPAADLINYEIVAEEIVRTLVSSIGLISAVPLTTFLASLVTKKSP